LETQFYIKLDAKFGRLVSRNGVYVDSGVSSNLENIDSDYIATYSFSMENDPEFFSAAPPKGNTSINGPVGRQFVFSIAASDFLMNNYSYAGQVYGELKAITDATYNIYGIDSYVEIIGNTFGRSVRIPITYFVFLPK
jgi:hypothetical protein